MLERCYDKAWQDKYKTYQGCAVHPDWHNFQTFARWHKDNYPNDGVTYHLDKDILVDGNKIYSESTCLFVTQADNTIKAHAKEYEFINPEGEPVTIYNMKLFCDGNGLISSKMSAVFNGRAKSHKGWTRNHNLSNQ